MDGADQYKVTKEINDTFHDSLLFIPRLPISTNTLKGDWQGRQDLNPRPSVLETDALPTELLP